MRVSLIEVARSWHLHHSPGIPLGLLPFALQRFMQGRSLIIEAESGGAWREVKTRILLWAFALDSPERAVPIWFSLLKPEQEEQCREESGFADIQVCSGCLKGGVRLHAHRFFAPARDFVAGRWSAMTDLEMPVLQSLSFVATKEEEWNGTLLSVPANERWCWLASISFQPQHGTQAHKLFLTALLSFPPLSDHDQAKFSQSVASTLHKTVEACSSIFSGQEPNGRERPAVWVDIPIAGRRNNRLPRAGEKYAPTEPDKPGEAAVSRLLDRCRALSPNQKIDSLSVLVIRRCGEPRGKEGAHARFVFAGNQKKALKSIAGILERERGLAQAVLTHALSLSNNGDDWSRIRDGLDRLGFSPQLVSSPDQALNALRSGKDFPASKELQGQLIRVLEEPFPVGTVVSNRIMGHGCSELVTKLWRSSGLIKTLKSYSRSTLLAEMTLFPPGIGKELFYVPLPLPPSRKTSDAEKFFLFFGVAMCPPDVIGEEAFREIVEDSSADLYLGFLEEAYWGMTEASRSAALCSEKSLDAPTEAQQCLQEAVEVSSARMLDILRLADFQADQQEFLLRRPLMAGWGIERLAVKGGNSMRLAHTDPLLFLDAMAEPMLLAALGKRRQALFLLSKNLSNVEHSGLLWDLIHARDVIRNISKHPAVSPNEEVVSTLEALEDHVSDIQSRWALLVKRHNGELFQEGTALPSIAVSTCRSLFDQAVQALAYLTSGDRKDCILQQRPPKLFLDESGNHAVCESPGALREIFLNLLANRLKHETRQLADHDWGLDLRFLTIEEVQGLPSPIPNAFARWRSELRQYAPCLIRAFPCTLSNEALQEHLWRAFSGEEAKNLGLWVLSTLTRAYAQSFQDGEYLREPIAPIAAANRLGQAGMLVLVPGR